KNASELDGMMAELAKYLPAVKETLIDERDRYLATKIWEAALSTEGTVLAVVGAGHLRGIQTCLEKFAEGEAPAALETLESIPPRSWLSAAAKWIIPVAIASLITVGFIRADLSEFLNKLVVYILWNGGLAALGAVIALGHPLAILVSFLGAPFTSLSPFIGVGILAGLVQAAVRKPRVCDVESISTIAGLKDVYRNRISRILLVFFLSSLGSSIGTFVSIPIFADLLAK
ncbi:MAG: TraB/GumN family protein, partial [Treponema sp.]|nr:TraB/GumN family protein [Treponema sp.]